MKPVLLLLALPLAGCGMVDVVSRVSTGDEDGSPKVIGTGKPVIEIRKAQAATSAEFSGALAVEIRNGDPSLTIEAQREILPNVRSEFKNGGLRVWTEGSMTTDGPVRIRFTTPALTQVEANGATTVDAGRLSGRAVAIEASGASKVKATGEADRLDVKAQGASEVSLAPTMCKKAKAEASGASKIWLGLSDSLEAQADGASTVTYRGAPNPLSTHATGVSSIGPAK